MSTPKKQITTVYINKGLWKKARKIAIDNDQSFSHVMEEALREWLERNKAGVAAA